MRSTSPNPAAPLYIDRRAAIEAQDLLSELGSMAAATAAARARDSRNVGNHIAFCRWRQIERLIHVLNSEEATGTRH